MRPTGWIASLLLGLACSAQARAAASADYAREQRWAQEITPAIVVGDPVYLTPASGRKFLAIYESPARPKAAAIVVHGAGIHPDWGIINTLRSKLPEYGYATLSVQMPVLAADAKPEDYASTFPEAVERLRSAVAFLQARGHGRIAIVAHSMGARMSNHFLATAAKPGIAAWASIGLGGELTHPERIAIPVLDLYGERDLPAVLAGVPGRAVALRRMGASLQIQVSGADHFFTGREDDLVGWVKRFLDRTLP
jgi:pimeloyl-ACP methyl ester carboxylesterase